MNRVHRSLYEGASCQLGAALILIMAVGSVCAEDWREFRGPTGQGQVQGPAPPVQWDVGNSVRWKVPVPGKGWSSPIVCDGRVFLTTAVPSQEDPPKQQSLRALCFDAATGKTVWDEEVFVKPLQPAEKLNPKNSYASPTPVTDGQHVYVHFGPDGTACLDRRGKLIWTNTLRYNSVHGAGGSPVLADRRLFVICDGAEAPFVAALDCRSGAELWRTARPPISTPKWSFGTPLLIEVKGQQQLVAPAAGMVCSYEPSSGRELWRVRYPNKWSIVPRPVFAHSLVFVCTGYDGSAELLAIRPTGSGDVTDSHVVWRSDRNVPHIPSPIVVEREIYLISDNGIATCLDVDTGKLCWRQRLGGNYAASPVHADGRIYLQSERGLCSVIAAGREFQQLGVTDLSEPILASCAVVAGAMFVRTESSLYRIE